MPSVIDSSRFGRVEIDPASVIEFPDGLIGLPGHRYALLQPDARSPFLWLQSVEDPGTALPVTNPHRFFEGFVMEVDDGDAERLALDDATPTDVYVTVTSGPSLADFTANLRAPILIRSGRADQIINHADGVAVKARLFPDAVADAGAAGA